MIYFRKCYFFVSPQEELLLEAIDSTGDGKTPQTALCVIDVFQEYEYIDRVVEYCDKQVVEQSVRDGIDCLKLKSFDGSIVKLYFDVKRRFEVGYPTQWTTLQQIREEESENDDYKVELQRM